MWNHSQMAFLEGSKKGGIAGGRLCFLQLWKSHHNPSSGAAETHTKTVELSGVFWTTLINKPLCKGKRRPRPNKSLLGGCGPHGWKLLFCCYKEAAENLSSPLQLVFTGFSSLTAEQNLTCWLYLEAAGNCEKLLLENYLTRVANLIHGPQYWCEGLSRPWRPCYFQLGPMVMRRRWRCLWWRHVGRGAYPGQTLPAVSSWEGTPLTTFCAFLGSLPVSRAHKPWSFHHMSILLRAEF